MKDFDLIGYEKFFSWLCGGFVFVCEMVFNIFVLLIVCEFGEFCFVFYMFEGDLIVFFIGIIVYVYIMFDVIKWMVW